MHGHDEPVAADDQRASAHGFAAAVREAVGSRLDERLGRERLGGRHAAVVEAVTGGKLLRPRVAWLVAHAYGSPDGEFLVRAGVALELLHSASLVHDDIIDESLTRRGRPTVHMLTDRSTATLIGDLLIGLAFEEAAPLGSHAVGELASAFTSLCLGQLREGSLGWGPEAVPQIEDYARLKTGALFGAAFAAAALAVGTEPSALEPYRTAGASLGVAFQLADDLVDVRGGTDHGKDAGADLRNGIPTLPIWHGFRSLDASGSAEGAGIEGLPHAAASRESAEFTIGRIARLVDSGMRGLPAAPRAELLPAAVELALAALSEHDLAAIERLHR